MKIPYKVVYKDKEFSEELVKEYSIMPSGKIVVMVEKNKGYPESLWFYNDGNNAKSYLEFLDIK